MLTEIRLMEKRRRKQSNRASLRDGRRQQWEPARKYRSRAGVALEQAAAKHEAAKEKAKRIHAHLAKVGRQLYNQPTIYQKLKSFFRRVP